MALKKVLILGKLPPPYMGPAVATQIILQSSLKDHFQLIHFDTKAYKSLEELGRWSIKKLFKNIALYFKLFWICILYRPSLVIIPISQVTIGYVKDSMFIIITKLTRCKLLIQLRGSSFKKWYDDAKGILKIYILITVKSADGVIVLGEKLRYLFRDFFPEKKIFVSPNGRDFNINKTQNQNDRIRILYFANLLASKGIEDVLEAVKILKEKNENSFFLDAVGEWNVYEQIENSCKDLVNKFHLPVRFFPATGNHEKENHFAQADVFIFTPRQPEGHPWVIVEALAAALPVISTDQGAITESVLDGVNGFIVPVRNPQAIAEKLELIIKDRKLRDKMSVESKRLYFENFTEQKMVDRLVAIFNHVIQS